MLKMFQPAVVLFALLSLLTGVIYPALVTLTAQGLCPHQANGSLLDNAAGEVIGSEWIGQTFSDPKYFWGRPSATAPTPYNGAASSGSNLGPTNPALATAVAERVKNLRDADPGNHAPIPVDLVTASASGLDPHISLAAAEYQISRVAKARNIAQAKLRALVAEQGAGRQWLMLGEPRVNVLQLNLALTRLDNK